MNNNLGERVIDWISINRNSIVVGVICGLVGVTYGATKAADITNKIWLRGSRQDFSKE